MAEETRTLYVVVEYTDHSGVRHERGEAVQYPKTDREASELARRGVLATKPVRRQAGEAPARTSGEKR
jgi:hypothetical protein